MSQQKKEKKRDLPFGGSSVIAPPSSKQKFEKISKYFKKPETELTVDSPFRNTLSDIEQNAAQTDDSDFRTPEMKSKRLKPFQELKTKNPPKKRLRQKKISSLIKSVEDNFSHENVNSEHLQMALALSKSVSESVEDNDDEVYNAVYNSTQEKISGVRRTLEEFGFKSGSSRLPGVYQKTFDANKKRKKSKFQYVTPILFLRTEEERQKIIASKVSLILSEKFGTTPENRPKRTTDGVSSEYLQNFLSNGSNLLQLNSLEVEQLTCERLYIKDLNLSPSKVKCGSLLKDWRSIPGRETTPVREISEKYEENITAELQEVAPEKEENILSVSEENLQESRVEIPQEQRSISPDLFESDDEVNKSFSGCNFKTINISHNQTADVKSDQSPKKSETFATFCDKIQSAKDLYVLDSKKASSDSGICEMLQEKEHATVLSSSNQQNETVSCVKMALNYDESLIERANAYSKDDIPETSLLSLKSSSQEKRKRHNFSSDDKDEVIESEKGILHFESFCKESEILSQVYVDLTQSSDEENEEKKDHDVVQEETNVSPVFTCKSDNGLRKTTAVFDLLQEADNQNIGENKSLNHTDNGRKEMTIGTETNTADLSVHNETEHLNCSAFQRISFEESFHRESLNVTDYIHNILNQNETNDLCASDDEIAEITKNSPEKQQTLIKHASLSSVASTCSQESIYISDEELNYSSIQALAKEISSNSDCSEESVAEDLDLSPKNTEIGEESRAVSTPPPEFVVRTTSVTPMPDFARMDTPKVTKELKKIGVKAMKRKRGVQLLKYIYDATHPLVGENVEFNDGKSVKKRKIAQDDTDKSCGIEIVGDIITENELQDLIFEKRQSSRIHSCRLPLQIAFFNLLSCNLTVRKKILLYEPLHLEELHLMLKNQGFKYHIRDLLTFLDRKCITVRTNHK